MLFAVTKGTLRRILRGDRGPPFALTCIGLHETMKWWFPSVMPVRQ